MAAEAHPGRLNRAAIDSRNCVRPRCESSFVGRIDLARFLKETVEANAALCREVIAHKCGEGDVPWLPPHRQQLVQEGVVVQLHESGVASRSRSLITLQSFHRNTPLTMCCRQTLRGPAGGGNGRGGEYEENEGEEEGRLM